MSAAPVNSPSPPPPPAPPTRRRLSFDRLVALISTIWVVAVLSSSQLRASREALTVTAFLIVLAFATSVVVLMVRKRILVIVNLAQVALFVALPWQVYSAFGHENYHPDHDPMWYDWLVFTLAHVLRAVDFLDIIASYGINLKNIHHHGDLSGCLLVWLHLAVDLFLFAAVARGLGVLFAPADDTEPKPTSHRQITFAKIVRAFLEWPRSKSFRRLRWNYLWMYTLLCPVMAYQYGWDARDWVMWPVDNVLRALDFVGVMNIFGWRLHGVSEDFQVATLGVILRLLIGLYIAEGLAYLSLRILGGRGLQTIEQVADHLCSHNEAVREAAADALFSIGRDAIPALVVVLASADEDVRDLAKETLNKIDRKWEESPNVGEAVKPLLARMSTALEERDVREAVKVLRQLGPAAKEAVPTLVRSLKEGHGRYGLRSTATEALDKIDPNWKESSYAAELVPIFVEAMQTAVSVENREGAVRALAELRGTSGSAISAIIAVATSDTEQKVREAAVSAIRTVGGASREAVPALTAAMKDGPPEVRGAAAAALAMHLPPAEIVPQLIAMLSDPATRKAATQALGSMGSAAAAAIPALTALVKGSESEPRWEAVDALLDIGPPADAVPLLIALIDDPKHSTNAMKELGKLGPVAAPAVPRLVTAVGAVPTRPAAVEALSKLGPVATPAVTILLKVLSTPGAGSWEASAAALNKISPDWAKSPNVSRIVPVLIQTLQSGDVKTQKEVVQVLEWIGAAAQPAESVLIAQLARGDEHNLYRTFNALKAVSPGWINNPAAQVVLRDVVKQIPATRDYQVSTLVDILNESLPGWAETAEGQAAVAYLVGRLGHGRDLDKEIVIDVLRDIGPPALALAGSPVRKFLKERKLRAAAEKALNAMEPPAK